MVLEIKDNTWIVDFGTCTHVTRNAKIQNEVKEPIDQHNVKIANKQSHVIHRQGDVNFYFPNGEIKIISNFLYILRFTKKLLSIGTMTDAGFVAIFDS
jgi:hypothetical protein